MIQDTVAANFAKLPSKKLGIVRGTVQSWHRMRLLDVRAPSDFSRVTPPPLRLPGSAEKKANIVGADGAGDSDGDSHGDNH